MLGVAAQRIAWPIRKPRNNADECHCAETRRDGAFRAICFVAPLARGARHGLRVASRISSRKASVAATRGLFRGSLAFSAAARTKRRLAPPFRFLRRILAELVQHRLGAGNLVLPRGLDVEVLDHAIFDQCGEALAAQA